MKLTRYLLLVAVFGLVGNLGAKNSDTSSKNIDLKPGTSVCIPCTPWCKAHPNSPRCN